MTRYSSSVSAFIISGFIAFTLPSCSDKSLDIVPRDRLSDASVWTDPGAADLFLNDIYSTLPNGNNWQDPMANWSDNSICGFAWPSSRTIMQQGLQNPTNNPSTHVGNLINWSTRYNVIRKTNLFIKGVTESGSLTEDYKKLRLAEARFFRAYNYHLLWMAYGGVPIITAPLDRIEQSDDIFQARNTSEEVLTFITDECAAIYTDLPPSPSSGRIGKAAAMVLKGWCELFAERWADAAASNKKIMDELPHYDLHPDYAGFFLLKGGQANVEGILYREYFPPTLGGRLDGYIGPTFTKGGAETSWGGINPTQDLVDDYAMDNGKVITDPTSGYDPQNPYENREPRFYQSIVYDNSFFYNDTLRMTDGSANAIDLTDKNDGTQTGYYMRKRLDDNLVLGAANWDGATSYQNYSIFRFAEVLLNYAEARNEAVGPDASVYAAINKIRERGGIPYLTPGLGQSEMREAIRRERRVELAFEDKRYWDLIRWRIAEVNINRPLKGMQITPGPGGVLEYSIVNATGGDRKFDPAKNYLFPIPEGVLNQNSKLEQNPGY